MIGVMTNGTTAYLSGPVVMLADSLADAECNCYSEGSGNVAYQNESLQHELWLGNLPTTRTMHFNEYLLEYGYLTKHIGP